ncbi:hypothetical protein FDECE_82 [Fusarium decemcellulare]|nr:hypothetical protein FDECE_82 [Fusarium decemcellulare]
MVESGATQYTPILLKGASLWLAFLGATNILRGAKSILQPSEQELLPSKTLSLMDSQFRYLGAFLIGYAPVTWWCSNDIQARAVPLNWIMGALFLSGIARLLSANVFGWGPSWTQRATVTEVVVPPLVYLFGIRSY